MTDTGPAIADQQALDLTELWQEDFDAMVIRANKPVIVYIPLESIGYSNSHIDICDDLIEASWTAERLATVAASATVEHDYPPGTYKTRLRLTLTGPLPDVKKVLEETVVLYRELDESNEAESRRFSEIRDKVLDFEDEVDTFRPALPDIIDWYFANLVGGAYEQMRYDAPDRYNDQVSKFPERRVGYWKSGFSEKLGGDCYTSSDGWLLPDQVDLDHFFKVTGQKYRMADFIAAKVLTVNSQSYVLADGITAWFPMAQYFKSRVCGSFALLDDGETWPPDTFDWSDASFTYSPYREHLAAEIPAGMRSPDPRVEGCLIDASGTMIIVNDGQFTHVLYDTKALPLSGVKQLYNAVSDVAATLASAIGISVSPACDWPALSDEDFEQLCYDVIFAHPQFNSNTIRKHGKSRSRDGGRDIEVYDLPRHPGARPRKWIFQCKLVTGSASLSATKLVDVGDMLDHYGVQGFGVMTSAPIDATLYDKLDAVCGKRQVDQMNFSVLELERALARNDAIRTRYFGRPLGQ